jgi:excisionase family DNA binding protein
MKKSMSVIEVSHALGVTRDRVLKMIHAGRLSGQRRGHRWFVEASEIEAFVPRGPGRPKRVKEKREEK